MLKGDNTYKVGQVDLFACAVILFSMVYGVPPFGEAKAKDPWYNLMIKQKYKAFWQAQD